MLSLFRREQSLPTNASSKAPLAPVCPSVAPQESTETGEATGLEAPSTMASLGSSPSDGSSSGDGAPVDTPELQECSPSATTDESPPAGEKACLDETAGPDETAGQWLDELPLELRVKEAPRPRGKRLAKPDAIATQKRLFTPQQRLLLLDSWRRSGLPAKDFAALVGISKHTLYVWKQRFDREGPGGLMDQPRGAPQGTRVGDLAKRTILMLKESHPEWGCQRISDMLLRGPALAASAGAVARVLREAGYELVEEPTRPHPDRVRRFERARPNQLWQTDLFTFMLKRQNRRLYLVAFLDDHSRFLVSFGLHASCGTAMVIEALEAGIAAYGPSEEILTDNGPQFVTWRGKSQFSKRLEQRGIKQIVARPRRPQTLGKIERFWGTLWRELLETAVFADLTEARARIGLFVDYYNFQRVHRGLGGLVPADRFFGAASEVTRSLKERVAANALDLARNGEPKPPFYVTGQVDGASFSLHAEGPRLIVTRPGQPRQEVRLASPPMEAPPTTAESPPVSPPPLASADESNQETKGGAS
jgi:transposase InsO family protein